MIRVLIPKEPEISNLFRTTCLWTTHRYRFANSETRRTDSAAFLMWVPLVKGFDLEADEKPVFQVKKGNEVTRLFALYQGIDVIGYMLDHREPFVPHVNGGSLVLSLPGRKPRDDDEAIPQYVGQHLSVLQTPAFIAFVHKVQVNTSEWK